MFRKGKQQIRSVPKITDISVPQLDRAIFQDAWDFLNSEAPYYAECVAEAVSAGHSPDAIYGYMIRNTMRPQIALRCKQAAQHLLSDDVQ